MNEASFLRSSWNHSLTRRLLRWLVSWRTIRSVLLATASVVTLVVLFYAVENWRGNRAWQNHRRALEAKGEKLDLAALAPPPVPDSRNLAMAPLLKPIFDFTRTPNGLRWHDTNGLARVQGIYTEKRMAGTSGAPVFGSLERGTFADLEACRKFYVGNTNYPQPTPGGNAAQDVLAAMGGFDRDFQELKSAAASRPECRFPIAYDDDMPAGILLPHLVSVKGMATVLELRATAKLELKQSPEAYSDWELGFRLADSIRDEPLLIDHLVRVAILQKTLQLLREGLVRHAWNDTQLSEMEKRLATADLLAEYNRAMRGERACAVGIVDWARRQGWRFDPSFIIDSWSQNLPACGQLLRFMPSGWFRQNMLTISRLHQEYTLAVVDERTRRVVLGKSAAGSQAIESLAATPFTVFAKELLPAVAKATTRSVRQQTLVDAARIACALERYRLTHGQLPDVLDALPPRFIDKIPTDVIDGQPLRYRKQVEGGYVVYSVGWNQTDDGGKIGWTTGPKPSLDLQTGDWVWSLPR